MPSRHHAAMLPMVGRIRKNYCVDENEAPMSKPYVPNGFFPLSMQAPLFHSSVFPLSSSDTGKPAAVEST